jgi:hypothetical protein
LVKANPDKEYKVKTDALNYILKRQLKQQNAQGKLHPIVFFLKKLSRPEVNYRILDKKLIAIIKVFKKWQHYLISAKH